MDNNSQRASLAREAAAFTIRPLLAVPLTTSQDMQLDAVFFSSSNTKSFASAADRSAFRERWLGRYLRCDPAHAFVAVDDHGSIVGYIVGSIADIARLARFADMASARTFAHLSACYPAHLHINVDERHRGSGLGARLIETFAKHAASNGAAGVHAQTGASSRNVAFYLRKGFHIAGRSGAGAAEVVFLARAFPARPATAITT